MNVKIIVDSTTDLLPQVKARMAVVPLTIHFGTQEYIDGVTITHRAFYEKLLSTQVLPTTSQATPIAFSQVFSQLEQGQEAVVITLSSRLSGTYQSAVIAAQDFPGVYVLDSGSVAIGAGILAELALQLSQEGRCAQDIVATLETEKQRLRIVALLDTLEYLKRGGRISKSVAFAGELLNIKPLIAVEDGEIRMLGKARGVRQGGSMLLQMIRKNSPDFTMPLMLGYTGLSDDQLQKFITDNNDLWAQCDAPVSFTCVGSVIGTHAGPGAIAAAFFQK